MELFEEFHRMYESFIDTKSRFLSRDPFEADELRQKAAITLWKDYGKLVDMTQNSVKAYIATCMKNALIDLRRREKIVAPHAEPEKFDSIDRWDNNLVGNLHVMQAMDKLPQVQRDIVFKTYFMRMNSVEIGKQLGMPATTVRSNLMRANAKLKRLLS